MYFQTQEKFIVTERAQPKSFPLLFKILSSILPRNESNTIYPQLPISQFSDYTTRSHPVSTDSTEFTPPVANKLYSRRTLSDIFCFINLHLEAQLP